MGDLAWISIGRDVHDNKVRSLGGNRFPYRIMK